MSIIFFPELLRNARKKKGFTAEQLAEALDIPVTTYNSKERGERSGWKEPEMQHRLCSLLDIDMAELQRSIEDFDELRNMHKEFNRALLKNYDYGRVMIENGLSAEGVLRKALSVDYR